MVRTQTAFMAVFYLEIAMPSTIKKQPCSTAPASSKRVSSPKKTAKKKQACSGDPFTQPYIDELAAQLRLFTHPDYSYGDYWPKLDRRLYGLLPDMIDRVVAVLEVRFPHKAPEATTHSRRHEHD